MIDTQIERYLDGFKLPDDIAQKIADGNAIRARGGQEVVDAIAEEHDGDRDGVVPVTRERIDRGARAVGGTATSPHKPRRLTVEEKNANELKHQRRARQDRYGY